MFKTGDRVICVNDEFRPDPQVPYTPDDIGWPVRGRIYTIREVVRTPMHGSGVRLLEVQSRQFRHDIGGIQEPCFSLSRFTHAETVDERKGY